MQTTFISKNIKCKYTKHLACDMATNQKLRQFFVVLLWLLMNAMTNAVNPENTTAAACDEHGDCLSVPENCHKICGCDRSGYMAIQYNETTKTCVVSFKHLMIAEIKIYGNDDNDDGDEGSTITGGTMSRKIRLEAEKIFNTIMVSAILFISCSAVFVISACYYCCRISYKDNALRKDVKALAKKLKRDGKYPKVSKKQPQTQVNQSCNIICEDAGVFVV